MCQSLGDDCIYLDVVAIGLNPLRLTVFVFSDGNTFLRIVRIRKSFTPFRIPDRPVIAPLVLSIGNIPFQSYPRISPKIYYELPLNLSQVQSGRSKVMKVHGYRGTVVNLEHECTSTFISIFTDRPVRPMIVPLDP